MGQTCFASEHVPLPTFQVRVEEIEKLLKSTISLQ